MAGVTGGRGVVTGFVFFILNRNRGVPKWKVTSFAPPLASDVDWPSVSEGTVVEHPQYGFGRIVAYEDRGEGRERVGRVLFSRDGMERRFVLSRSPIRLADGEGQA